MVLDVFRGPQVKSDGGFSGCPGVQDLTNPTVTGTANNDQVLLRTNRKMEGFLALTAWSESPRILTSDNSNLTLQDKKIEEILLFTWLKEHRFRMSDSHLCPGFGDL